jgi:hypothetical protein
MFDPGCQGNDEANHALEGIPRVDGHMQQQWAVW